MPDIEMQGRIISYRIRESARAKRQSIVVQWDGTVEVVVPKRPRLRPPNVRSVLFRYADWILRHVDKQKGDTMKKPLLHHGVPRQIVERRTRELVAERMAHHCDQHGFKIDRLVLKSFRTQWGNCSQDGRIGLHYKLSLLPPDLAEYVIIHELCHTVHFNHSRAFWALVESLCPEYRAHRKTLNEYIL